jgi:hypothetical protein
MTVTAFKRGFSFAISGPLATAWEMAPQTAITTASVYMVAQFGMAHHILPWWVAVPMAAGFEWTWLRSIRTAGLVRRSKESELWIGVLTWTAMITVICYGVLYILGLSSVGVIPEQLGAVWGIPLALAKVIPIAVMGFAAANLHRIHKQQVVEDADKRAAESRARLNELQSQQDTLELERQRKLMDLEMYRKGLEIKREMRQPKVQTLAGKKKPVTIDGVTYESRAAAAKALGISPQAVSKRAKE